MITIHSMKQALYIVAGWLMTIGSLTMISCQNDQSNERIAKERNSERFNSDAEKDAQLVVDIAASNYAEIEMAKRARERSENKEVKDLAGMLEADHITFVNQLKAYAARKNISLPGAASNEVVESSKRMAERNQPGEFDKKWCAELLDQHEQTISKLEKAANDAIDPDLRAWVNNTLPKVRVHRDKLRECNDSIR
jgi:putative membrane protein